MWQLISVNFFGRKATRLKKRFTEFRFPTFKHTPYEEIIKELGLAVSGKE